MAILNTPIIVGGGTSEEDLQRWANVNEMLKHSEGVYDNIEYSTYFASVIDNGDGTINIDFQDVSNKDYIIKTTYNNDDTISLDALKVKGEE